MMATSNAPDADTKDVRIERVFWSDHEADLAAVRRAVFIEEQGVPEDLEWDGEDAESIHFLARSGDGTPIGCIRLLPSGQISRLSVIEAWRHQGIGQALLDAVEDEARRRSMPEIYLHAQTQATHFYEAAGFSVSGGIFIEADIPHRQMFKDLR
jgi:predicted GNAT family N-acyltransferase